MIASRSTVDCDKRWSFLVHPRALDGRCGNERGMFNRILEIVCATMTRRFTRALESPSAPVFTHHRKNIGHGIGSLCSHRLISDCNCQLILLRTVSRSIWANRHRSCYYRLPTIGRDSSTYYCACGLVQASGRVVDRPSLTARIFVAITTPGRSELSANTSW
ncbi:hypothetical protein EJ02DRAFT_87816 [Clathrospora elynae]|uniref:Uncharacterized protein n=1 Tax=Clathrospora elynae TaxID=706981 RepID=A0A6A5SG50_9PLEO|nr:hypothetical protein EJ02DRAFT_87816 [Clathrospora elynae]